MLTTKKENWKFIDKTCSRNQSPGIGRVEPKVKAFGFAALKKKEVIKMMDEKLDMNKINDVKGVGKCIDCDAMIIINKNDTVDKHGYVTNRKCSCGGRVGYIFDVDYVHFD